MHLSSWLIATAGPAEPVREFRVGWLIGAIVAGVAATTGLLAALRGRHRGHQWEDIATSACDAGRRALQTVTVSDDDVTFAPEHAAAFDAAADRLAAAAIAAPGGRTTDAAERCVASLGRLREQVGAVTAGTGDAAFLAAAAASFATDLDELERIVVFRVVGSGERSR